MRGLHQVVAEGPIAATFYKLKVCLQSWFGRTSKIKAQIGKCKSKKGVLQPKYDTLESCDIKTLYLLKSRIVHRVVWIGSFVKHYRLSSSPLEAIA